MLVSPTKITTFVINMIIFIIMKGRQVDAFKTNQPVFHPKMCGIPLKANWKKSQCWSLEDLPAREEKLSHWYQILLIFRFWWGGDHWDLQRCWPRWKDYPEEKEDLTTKELGLSKWADRILPRPAPSPLNRGKFLSTSGVPSPVSFCLCKAHYYYNGGVIREENAGPLSIAGGLLFKPQAESSSALWQAPWKLPQQDMAC